jgi:hypothetical protein
MILTCLLMCVEIFKDSTYIKHPLLVCESIPAFDVLCVGFCNSTPSSSSFAKFLLSLFKCEGDRVGTTHLHLGQCVREKYE